MIKTKWFLDVFTDITRKFNKIKKEDYLSSWEFSIIDQGKNYIWWYTDSSELVNFENSPCIIFWDHTKIFKFVDTPFTIWADWVKVLQCSNELDPKYAYHYLSSVHIPWKEWYQRFFKHLKTITVSYPDLPTQKAIAKKLDHIQSLIDQKKEAIAKTEELGKSIFVEMFGDIQSNTNNFDTIELWKIWSFKSWWTPSRKHPEYFEWDNPWVTTVSLWNYFIDWTDAVEYLTEEAIKKSATKIIKKWSLIIWTRVWVGKVSINQCDISTNQDIVSMTDISQDFDVIYLSDVVRSYISFFDSQKRWATIQWVKGEVLKWILVPIPGKSLQQKYSKIVIWNIEILKNQSYSLKQLELFLAQQMQESFNII